MSCERYASALSDHAIGAPLDRAAETHLTECAGCRARLDADRRSMATMDDELASALSVEPSADFNAHVRVRIANEPAPVRFWPRAWVLAAAASVVLAIGWLLLLNARHVPTGSDASSPTDIVLRPEAAKPVARVEPKPESVREPGGVRRRQASSARVARSFPGPSEVEGSSPGPEVIVPPDRAEAIRRFVTAVAHGRVEIPDGALLPTASSEHEIAPLTLEPIVIPPVESGMSTTTTEVSHKEY